MKPPIPFVAIAGTHAWRPSLNGQWYQSGSPWMQMMHAEGFVAVDPFVWNTGLDGVLPWRKHAGWVAAAHSFSYWWKTLDPAIRARLAVFLHSHGLQPIAMAAAWFQVEIPALTSVCSPIRADVPYAAAVRRIRFWQHLHSDSSDWMQVLGGVCDGVLGNRRRCDDAHCNITIADVGHSGLLTSPAHFHHWHRLLENIRKRDRA